MFYLTVFLSYFKLKIINFESTKEKPFQNTRRTKMVKIKFNISVDYCSRDLPVLRQLS